MSQSGRPLSGFVRPGTQSSRPGTMEQAIRTPRTAQTARPVTSASGRYVRLGTVSFVSVNNAVSVKLGYFCESMFSEMRYVPWSPVDVCETRPFHEGWNTLHTCVCYSSCESCSIAGGAFCVFSRCLWCRCYVCLTSFRGLYNLCVAWLRTICSSVVYVW